MGESAQGIQQEFHSPLAPEDAARPSQGPKNAAQGYCCDRCRAKERE